MLYKHKNFLGSKELKNIVFVRNPMQKLTGHLSKDVHIAYALVQLMTSLEGIRLCTHSIRMFYDTFFDSQAMMRMFSGKVYEDQAEDMEIVCHVK